MPEAEGSRVRGHRVDGSCHHTLDGRRLGHCGRERLERALREAWSLEETNGDEDELVVQLSEAIGMERGIGGDERPWWSDVLDGHHGRSRRR